MANVRKRISELTPLTSASLDTTIVGVDNGTTYKIELDTLADAVTARVNTLDRDRLSSLESVTSSFETKGRSILSGSVSYTSLTNIPQGIVSQSTDLSYFATTGSNNFVGNQTITGSLIVSGSNIELKRDWPAVGTESHFFRLSPFTSSTNRYYDGLSIGVEHWDDGTGTYEHSLLIHSFDDDINQNYGAELNIGPYRTHMRVYPSGSNGNLSNVSVQELSNGKSQALVYGDYVQLGAFVSQDILIGNTGSLITITGSNMLLDTPLTSSEAIVASLFSGSVSGIGNVTTFSSSIDSKLHNLENATSSYLTSLSGAISSSSQLTSSYDTRYTLSGSVQPLPSNLLSSSAQITAFGFVSGSYETTGRGIISSSANLVTTSSYNADSASFDTRINSIMVSSGSNLTYLLEAYANVTYTLPGGFTEDPCRYSVVSATENVPSNWFNTSTYTFTPQKAGYWEIAASYDVYRNAEASMAIKKNGSNVAAAGSFNAVAQQIKKIVYLNGSTDYINIINVGGAALQRAQFDSRSWFQAKFVGNISGSTDLPAGVISGSSQLTSSFDTRYALSASFVSSSNVSSIQTITSASYAALTPVSGTLYIIIG